MGRLSRESSVDGDGEVRHITLSKGHSHLMASFQIFENPTDCGGFTPDPDRRGAGLMRRMAVRTDHCGQGQSSDETELPDSSRRDTQRRRLSWREPSAKRQRSGNVNVDSLVVAWFVQSRITAISRTRPQDAPAVRWLYNANNNQESNTRT